jgi:radical SAM superfamily enzyme YgiQ (UPF0313 family)
VTLKRSDYRRARDRLSGEIGAVHKDWGGRLPIALCYPNTYRIGMCNLGFQALYGVLNARSDVVCERLFAEPPLVGGEAGRGDWTGDESYRVPGGQPAIGPVPVSVESGRPLADFAVLALTLSFELDYFNIGDLLRRAGIPPLAADRDERHPLVVAGGPAVSGNPEPVAPFLDAAVIGEAEPIIDPLLEVVLAGDDRVTTLRNLARLEGVYVPSLYRVAYRQGGGISDIEPVDGAAMPVARLWARNVNEFDTTSVVLSHNIELGDMYLVEMTRGCARGCRFCLAGYTSLPVRHRTVERVVQAAEKGLPHRKRIGLISAATTDHPSLDQLLVELIGRGAQVSLSSLRIDRLTEATVAALVRSETRNITLAPEAGSQRMRDIINKRTGYDQILRAARLAGEGGIPKVKLYFMLGLPGETEQDVDELTSLCQDVLREVQQANRRARLAISLSPHVPKAQTAFQWEAQESAGVVTGRIQRIQRALQPLGVSVRHESPALSRVQAVLARGDRRIAMALLQTRNLKEWEAALGRCGLSPDRYVGALDPLADLLPWSVVSTGVPDWYLRREFKKARDLVELPVTA